jgi:predicted nucleic acid-binding protein
MNAIDTNVVAYSVDADAGEKRLRALSLLDRLDPAETVIPWQVACEAGSVLLKLVAKGRSQADPTALLSALTSRFRLAMPTEDLVLQGLRLRTTYQMSYWDALLLAACLEAGVTRLYTEDIQSRPVIEGIEIIDPFGPAN